MVDVAVQLDRPAAADPARWSTCVRVSLGTRARIKGWGVPITRRDLGLPLAAPARLGRRRSSHALDSIGINAGKTRISVWSVMKLLVTVSVFVLLALWVSRWLERRVLKLDALAPTMRIGIAKFMQAFLVGLSVLIGLNAAGLDLTTLNVLTGAIGIGLGFGLQSIAANFVSGFVLLMDRSIKPGDVISFTGTTGTTTEGFGWVEELRGRYVVVRDRDGVETLVPNQHLITNPVINWSYTDPRVRLKLPVRDQLPGRSRTGHAAAAARRPKAIRASCASPAPVARLMDFGDHGIELELRFWIPDPAGRRQQRALRRQSPDLAAVQAARHHDPGGAARNPRRDGARRRPSRRATAPRRLSAMPFDDHTERSPFRTS